jgi:hypothetical protein
MEQKRKDQLLQQLDNAYLKWFKNIDQKSEVDDIEEVVAMISNSIAFGTIIVTGRHNPSAYIGTYKQCKNLKNTFDGQIGAISNVWYWIGYALSTDITKIVANPKKNLVISVPFDDLEDAVLNFAETITRDIRYGCTQNGRIAYIGSFKACTILRKKYGGKIGKIHNSWHWIGFANFQDVDIVYKTYQRNAKRFNRKKVVLTV